MLDGLQECIDGLSHHQAGRLAEAETLYRASLAYTGLAAVPVRMRALHMLGLLLLATSRPAEAASCWAEILAARPDDVAALVNLACAKRETHDWPGALAACDSALAVSPGCLDAAITRGSALLGCGRVADGVSAYRLVAAQAPNNAVAHAGLAIALLRAKQPDDAIIAADRAVLLDDALADAHFARGTALSGLKRPAEAIVSLERAVALAPRHAEARMNLGNALADRDRLGLAEAALRAAIVLDPSLPEAHASLGCLLAGLGRIAEAVSACETAIALRPDFGPAHWNLSYACLLGGEFERGWAEYEWRKHRDVFGREIRPLAGPEWTGDDLAGRTLLVHAEQGLGDTIQLARFLPVLAARGAAVILACAAPLMPLLAPLAKVVDRNLPLPAYDVWINQMSLPRLLGVRENTIPAAPGYLEPRAGSVEAWRSKLPPSPLVGIVWSGNPAHSNDARRSIPASMLAPILATGGCRFVSLQAGPPSGDLAGQCGISDRSRSLTDFAATADLVAALDLVIAVDTSTAHLAGALGKPVWILVPYLPDWRWMIGRTDSPWYASARLFRQTVPGDWRETIAEVAAALAGRYASRAANVPATAAMAVTTVPHARSMNDTDADQPRTVDKFVMS